MAKVSVLIPSQDEQFFIPTKNSRSWENIKFHLDTKFPVANDSLDHLYPLGAMQDNSRNSEFNEKLKKYLGSVLDLGCAGGGFVKDCLDEGRIAVGLEGSDYPKVNNKFEWVTIPDNLFTCDITKPFSLSLGNQNSYQFDIVTAWEVLEHIEKKDLNVLFTNIRNHLAENGVFIASISNKKSFNKKGGVDLHRIQENEEWWTNKLLECGFVRDNDVENYFGKDWVRNERKSFHFVLRKK